MAITFKSINPYDQSILEEFELHSSLDVEKKLTVATSAYKKWSRQGFAQRGKFMLQAAAVLRKNKEVYAQTITLEMGKVIQEARAEVEKCAGACEYYAHNSEHLLADELIKTEASKSYVTYQPTGAVLAIMPWNFPLWQVFRFAAPTLMAGNVGLLKHAPNVCRTALLIEEIFREAEFPEGVFQTLIIDTNLVENIVAHDIVHAVTLTGSEYAGTQVAALAGRYIKKSVLELGGSDAFILLKDANLEKAVEVAMQSRMRNAGQSCIAAKRFIVVEEIKDEFVSHFKKRIEALHQGNPLDANVTTGPLARVDLVEKLVKQMNESVAAGAIMLTGGKYDGCNFIPGLIDHVRPGMPVFDEETFGPLAPVITVKNDQEAIILANQSRYGLGASIWSADIERATLLARDIEAGAVFINSLMRSDARLPFGGIKKSGYGRELSAIGIREFVNAKTILIEG